MPELELSHAERILLAASLTTEAREYGYIEWDEEAWNVASAAYLKLTGEKAPWDRQPIQRNG